MSESTNIEDIEWGDTPIKHCEFIRASRKISSMKTEDLEDMVTYLSLGSLSKEDYDFISKNISPTLKEAIEGSKQTRITFLHNLMKLISYRYKLYKRLFYDAVKNSDIAKADEYTYRIFHHYEALRNLKKRLIGGKEILLRDMPKVEWP